MKRFVMSVVMVALAGCASYTWRSSVPEEMRTVAVPEFKNSSNVTGLGSKVTTQVLREFQREGTMKLSSLDDCALEVRGEIEKGQSEMVAYDRQAGSRTREHRFTATAIVSVVDRKAGKTLIDRRKYTASTSFLANDDVLTGERDASGRLAEDFARQIVDDVLMIKW